MKFLLDNQLFDKFERTYAGPAEYGEPEFRYTNRSNRKHFIKAREILEEWFFEYAKENKKVATDLRSRFRSNDDEHHLAALTELYLYQLLLKNGYQLKVHPELLSIKSKPEFLVIKDGQPVFVVEATIVFGNPVKKRIEKFESSILNAIDQIHSPEFLVSITIKSVNPDAPPPLNAIKKEIQKNLSQLNYKEVCNQIEQNGNFPKWPWKERGWDLEFLASPVKEEAIEYREKSSRIVGAILYPVKNIDLSKAIKKRVFKKATKYGDVGMPFIICVNVINDSAFCDDYSIMCSLFGDETIHITTYKDGHTETRPGRTLDGIWVHPKMGIKNTRISGLLVLPGLTSSTFESIRPALWHHPRAKYPFNPNDLKIIHRIHNPKSDKMEELSI